MKPFTSIRLPVGAMAVMFINDSWRFIALWIAGDASWSWGQGFRVKSV